MWRKATLGLILLVLPSVGAETWVVRPDGSGDFPTIQSAISGSSNGDVIELTDGVFSGLGNRDINFFGKALAVRSQSHDPRVCVIDCAGSVGSPHRGFRFVMGEGPGSVLEAVTITHGAGVETGGAVLCEDASPTLRGCVFEDNAARQGGAVFCHWGEPRLEDCVFTGNVATDHGGGLCLHGCGGAVVDGCEFTSNHAVNGAAAFVQFSDLRMSGCSFSGNSASTCGGAFYCRASSSFLDRCAFSANSASASGGAVYCQDGSSLLDRCTFTANTAITGGAVHCEAEYGSEFVNCLFTGNSAGGYADQGGGAIFCRTSPGIRACVFDGNSAPYGGAIRCTDESHPTCTGCTFVRNEAYCGGALAGRSGTAPSLLACTLVRNAASGAGAGIFAWEGTVSLANCIVAFSRSGEAVFCGGAGEATLACCDVYGNAGGDWVGCLGSQLGSEGNLSADPQFCDLEQGDFTVSEDSPCAPGHNPECGLIGAWPVGCIASTVPDDDGPPGETPAGGSWGRIKNLFR